MRILLASLSLLIAVAGCSALPHVTHRPVLRNPFPQLTRVAVAPFFNLSAEPAINGRQVALAYFNEGPGRAQWNPLRDWMRTSSYLVSLRIGGALSIAAGGVALLALVRDCVLGT